MRLEVEYFKDFPDFYQRNSEIVVNNFLLVY